jgi:hypothetical protein
MSQAAPVGNLTTIDVMDFRRRNLVLQWHALGGTWTACEYPPPLVHGVALISPTGLNICVYGQGGRLTLQIGPASYVLDAEDPRITCRGGLALFGLRRRFLVKARTGQVLFSYRYWRGQGRDFFHWFAQHAGNSEWRATCASQWSEGVAPSDFPLPRQ